LRPAAFAHAVGMRSASPAGQPRGLPWESVESVVRSAAAAVRGSMERHDSKPAGQGRSQDEARHGEQEHPAFADHRARFRLSAVCRQPDEARHGDRNERPPGVGPGEPPSRPGVGQHVPARRQGRRGSERNACLPAAEPQLGRSKVAHRPGGSQRQLALRNPISPVQGIFQQPVMAECRKGRFDRHRPRSQAAGVAEDMLASKPPAARIQAR